MTYEISKFRNLLELERLRAQLGQRRRGQGQQPIRKQGVQFSILKYRFTSFYCDLFFHKLTATAFILMFFGLKGKPNKKRIE